MDILDTLAGGEEHEVVAALLQELVDGKSKRVLQRASTLKQIKKNLVPHARAEENRSRCRAASA